jgi:hypothetical protein
MFFTYGLYTLLFSVANGGKKKLLVYCSRKAVVVALSAFNGNSRNPLVLV